MTSFLITCERNVPRRKKKKSRYLGREMFNPQRAGDYSGGKERIITSSLPLSKQHIQCPCPTPLQLFQNTKFLDLQGVGKMVVQTHLTWL